MRHVREILRLSLDAGLSTRVVGERIGVGSTTVRDTLKRFARAGLSWPAPATMSDADLERQLYGLPVALFGFRDNHRGRAVQFLPQAVRLGHAVGLPSRVLEPPRQPPLIEKPQVA